MTLTSTPAHQAASAQDASQDTAQLDARQLSAEEHQAYWAEQAAQLTWETPWDTVHTLTPPNPETQEGLQQTWFAGGTLNAAVNCADRHVAAGNGDKVALYFEGEPGDRRTVTYRELTEEVSQAAHALTELGIGRGDRVVVYLPVLVETIVITLACARIGAVHSLVFGGFSAEALRFRIEDTRAKLLVTSDGQYRRGKAVPVKDIADEAASGDNQLEHVLVIDRTGHRDIPWTEGRDIWWDQIVPRQPREHTAEAFDAENPMFIMYTSGTTGKPKGLVHTTGGYLTGAVATYNQIFAHPDPEQRAGDVHWCTADLAWVTAHTYEIYGPLGAGATQVIYEGVPNAPHPGRHFEVIQRYGVTSYYTAPTLVRSLMGWFPDGIPAEYDLSSIRLGGTVGEAVNPEAARWLRQQIGRDTYQPANPETGEPERGISMVDTWWQSETGSTILTPRPDATTVKPGSVGRDMPGVATAVVDDQGNPPPAGTQGNIVLTQFPPSMARTVWGNPKRWYTSYWKAYAEYGWFTAGDGAKIDADGDTWILGRTDDVINISGHRLSTIEIESALVTDPGVVEAGVCPVPDAKTGHAANAFVVPADQSLLGESADKDAVAEFTQRLRDTVTKGIGPIAKPARIILVPDVPKTRSGKIMRRILSQACTGEQLGDTTSLRNEECIPDVLAAARA